MTEETFTAMLARAASDHGIDLSEESARMCFRHVALMLEWNRRTNLTRITDLEDILVLHVLDSLIPSRWLPSSGRALDIGSGAGFPGTILALALPGLDMTLIEASRKKASFLKVLTSQLRLSSLRVFHGSWQTWLRSTTVLPSVECITMRAVRLEEAHLLELATRCLRPGGVFAYWAGPEGKRDEDRSGESLEPPGLRIAPPVSYRLPAGKGERRLLRWIRKP